MLHCRRASVRGCWDLTRTSEKRLSESLSEEVLSVELVEGDLSLWGQISRKQCLLFKLLVVLQ